MPALLTQGFRPFFLAAAIWAITAMALWLWLLSGGPAPPSAFGPLIWHAHEMLFGFVVAAVAGFLLTAIPNWTGRLPVRGWSLGLLIGLWVAGRIAVAVSDTIGAVPAAVIDLAFLVAFGGIVLREITAGGNWRNLPMVGAIMVLAVSNLLVHLDYAGGIGDAALGLRLGIGMIALLITLVGGRIVPSFTRNWLQKQGVQHLPAPFGWPDRAALVTVAAAVVMWAVAPEARATGVVAVLAALTLAVRLGRWCGYRTLREPLLWVLHLGYAWLVVGFGLLGFSLLSDVLPVTAAFHALTAGAAGTMILAVMSRATLGHTGQSLTAGPGTTAAYIFVTAAAILRVISGVAPGIEAELTILAGLFWIAAFALFVVVYGPLLLGMRRPAAER
ncbi:MAG: NnrS family protein [Alphaproteobacteria bacterium]